MMKRFSIFFTLLVALAALANGFAPMQTAAPRTSMHAAFRVGWFYSESLMFFVVFFFLLMLSESVTALSAHQPRVKIEMGDGEPIESALRRFKREVNKSGHLMELRHRRYFENSQERKKRKVKEGRLRKKFERMQRRRMQQQS